MAVIATLSKGYDLDYIWKQVDRDLAKNPAGYYIPASESGGEPPGRWWGPGARALGLEPGQLVERKPYDLLFGERKAPDASGARAARRTGSGLREDQAAAALSVLADGRRVSVVNAPADAGKTRVLAEIARAWGAAGASGRVPSIPGYRPGHPPA